MKRILFLLLLPLVLTGCKSSETVDVEFPLRQPDPNQVAQVLDQDKREIAGYQPGDFEKGVLETYLHFNRRTVGEKRSRAELEEDFTRFRIATTMSMEQGGRKPLRKLIIWLLFRFEKSLADLLAAARSKEATAALLSGSKPPEEIREKFEQFSELGGDFISNAYNAGLLKPSKKGGIELAAGGQFFIRLAFKVRWAMILPEATRPRTWLLNSFENKWYDIWTVERSKTASLSRKLMAIARLKKRNPAYRDHSARGIVYYQHKDYRKSLRCFNRALADHPKDQRIKTFKRAAESRL
jgi:hypothetical protein